MNADHKTTDNSSKKTEATFFFAVVSCLTWMMWAGDESDKRCWQLVGWSVLMRKALACRCLVMGYSISTRTPATLAAWPAAWMKWWEKKKNTQFGLRIEIEINYVDGPWPMACCKRKRLNASNMHHTLFLSHLFTNPNFFISFDSTAVHRLTEGDTKKNAVFQPLMHFGYRIDDDGLHRPKWVSASIVK